MSRREKNGAARATDSANGSLFTDQLFERISRRAYELYELRGGARGHDAEDWLEAERLVRLETAARSREQG